MRISTSFIGLTVILMVIAISSCNSSKGTIKTTASWVNKERTVKTPYKSTFIVVLTDNREVKTVLENNLAKAIREQGLTAYTSMDNFGPISGREGLPVKESFLKKVAELNCESIFTVALIHETSETKYTPSSTMSYAPYPTYGYYGMFGGYYEHQSTVYTPGYYTNDRKFFLESNLYDAKSQELVLSIQSKADNPDVIEKSSKTYTEELIKELKAMGAWKK
jgi:hypothetical protein